MAIIAQRPLFGWQEIEPMGDLARLRLVLRNLPDEELVAALQAERGLRRWDDYPVRAMWNATVAGVVSQHPTVAALLEGVSPQRSAAPGLRILVERDYGACTASGLRRAIWDRRQGACRLRLRQTPKRRA
jgi:hypothetical protein